MLWVIIIAIAVIFFLFSKSKEKSGSSEPPAPPSTDALTGCTHDCGYYVPEFEKNGNGDYDATRMVYCKYQHKTIREFSKCPFAEDHPELLVKSRFVDEDLLNIEL